MSCGRSSMRTGRISGISRMNCVINVESGVYMQDQMADGAETEAVPDGINTDSTGYDYGFFGSFRAIQSRRTDPGAAKRCLVSGGELIIAACNPFGLKYWAGARADDHGFSKENAGNTSGNGWRNFLVLSDAGHQSSGYHFRMNIFRKR